ncbi:hypothetical protein AOC36_05860 [Erysipelothrix larvae]|uniref:DUF885 domain-containing protein n=2 Tax=Erysipelothrix larvae TaxID=1514105 RepID=A0A0X8GZX5_9FIRM|nr:hypothetical protein AOC36_05860 [Erysipelothrix larvae]
MKGQNQMKKILVTLLSILFVVSGCKSNEVITYEGTFDEYVNTLYAEIIGSTDIGINLSFNDPEAFGIVPEPYSLGFSTQEDYDESSKQLDTMIKTLRSFTDDSLTQQQIIDRDAIIEYLSAYLGSEKFYEYEEGDALSSSRSYIMSLPSYLDMYVFNSERDIEYYFNFVNTLEENLLKFVELEKTRQSKNMGLSQKELDSIVKAADSTATAAAQEDYFLNRAFERQMASISFIDQQAKDDYILKHQEAMKSSFSKAYASLASSIREIEGGELRGLANKENGKAYYEYLFKKNTGSSYSVDQVSKQLKSRKKDLMYSVVKYFQTNYDETLEESVQNGNVFDGLFSDEKSVLTTMIEKMGEDFPMINVPNYSINFVDESLEDSASPAFYFTPKVDATDDNVQAIYVNGNFSNDKVTTYIHEGIFGHMYQFNYFKQSGENQIRSFLSSSANAEGWANYTENYATKYVLGDDLGLFFQNYNELLSNLYVQLDIGINYEGWSQQETLNFLVDEGWYSETTSVNQIEELYLAFVENPCVYPMYYVSSMYIRILSEKAEKAWGADYSDYAFHEALLKQGSTSFDMLEKALDLNIMK